MDIVRFDSSYLEKAQVLALDNYNEERESVPQLPVIDKIPGIEYFASSDMSVMAVENGKLLGFLGCWGPFENALRTYSTGVFSPVNGHAAVNENRELIYQRMYQAAAEIWVRKGAVSHAVSLYAHDYVGIHAFFDYGFGHRCTDALFSSIEDLNINDDVLFYEAKNINKDLLYPLCKGLCEHFGESPCFMYTPDDEFDFEDDIVGKRIFVAEKDGNYAAYLSVADNGETFVSELPQAKNIKGAYCLPKYRGRYIFQRLIAYTAEVLKNEGVICLGVDYESINPTANRFWQKNFVPYTNSVVRRIDESIMRKYEK